MSKDLEPTVAIGEPVSLAERLKESGPADWRSLGLHAWPTIALRHGVRRPKADKRAAFHDEAQRLIYMKTALRVGDNDARDVMDVMKQTLVIDERIITKLMDEAYQSRVPYIRLAESAPADAVEVWRQKGERGEGTDDFRTYYLVPLAGDSQHDGYVVLVGADRIIFNLIFFKSSYADSSLRRGDLLYKRYADSILCTVGCCDEIIVARRAQGILRDKNRVLEQTLRRERQVVKALTLQVDAFKRLTSTASSPKPAP